MKIVSIVIATYNAEKVLPRCLKSIRSMKTDEIELVLVDGASKDSTLSIINDNKDIVDKFISEPDKGIYDAWNKAIKLATGEWIMFLGADDMLFADAMKQVISFAKSHQDNHYDLISCKMDLVDERENHKRYAGECFDYGKFCRRQLSFAHPAMLQNRSIFERFGGFDIKYRIIADSEFYMRNGHNFTHCAFVDVVLARMQQGGMSVSYRAIWEAYSMRSKHPDTPKMRNFIGAVKMSVVLFLSKLRSKM